MLDRKNIVGIVNDNKSGECVGFTADVGSEMFVFRKLSTNSWMIACPGKDYQISPVEFSIKDNEAIMKIAKIGLYNLSTVLVENMNRCRFIAQEILEMIGMGDFEDGK